MRNLNQTSKIVESTIDEIRKQKDVTKEFISKICKKNKINENHIYMGF